MRKLEQGNLIWQLLFSILWIGNVICWISIIFKIPYISSIIFAISLGIVCVMLLFSLEKDVCEVKKTMILFLMIIAFVSLSLFISDLSMENIKQYMQYMALFLFLFIMQMYTINTVNYNIMMRSTIFIGLLFILGYMVYPNNIVAGAITLNFHNSNAAGIAICVNTLFMISTIKDRKQIVKFGVYILAIIDFYILLLTKCRGAIFSCGMGLITSLCLHSKFKKTNKFIISFLLNIPILFLLIYVYIYTLDIVPYDFMIGDKLFFSGRENIWVSLIEFMFSDIKYILFGHFVSGNSFNSQGSIFFSFGILGFIVIMLFITKYVYAINDVKSKNSRQYVWMFLYTMLIGCTESSIITGMLTIYIYLGSYIQLAQYEKLEENNKLNDVNLNCKLDVQKYSTWR